MAKPLAEQSVPDIMYKAIDLSIFGKVLPESFDSANIDVRRDAKVLLLNPQFVRDLEEAIAANPTSNLKICQQLTNKEYKTLNGKNFQPITLVGYRTALELFREAFKELTVNSHD